MYCWDGVTVQSQEVYSRASHTWVLYTYSCPTEPAEGVGNPDTATICWDNSIVYTEIWSRAVHSWVPSGRSCPTQVCTPGDTRCINDIEEVCNGYAWNSNGLPCSNEPCSEGAYECRNDGQYWACVDGTMNPTGEPCAAPMSSLPWWLIIPAVASVGLYVLSRGGKKR